MLRILILIFVLSLGVVGCAKSNNQKVEMSNGFLNIVYFHGEKYSYVNAPGSGSPETQYVTDIEENIGQLDNPVNSNQKEIYAINGVDPKEYIALKIVNDKGEIQYIKLTHATR